MTKSFKIVAKIPFWGHFWSFWPKAGFGQIPKALKLLETQKDGWKDRLYL